LQYDERRRPSHASLKLWKLEALKEVVCRSLWPIRI
jgi:hypothetical protein